MKNVNSLSDILQSIVNENPNKHLLINEYFRIPKENQEFLKKYKYIHSKDHQIIGKLLLQIPQFLVITILNVLISFIYRIQNRKFEEKITKTDELFVSHATSNNTVGNTDIYYENIPNLYLERNKHVTILYLNHGKSNYLELSQKLINKNNASTSLLMPKFMGLIEYMRYLKLILKVIFERIQLYSEYKKTDKFKSIIVLNSIFSLLKRETYSNSHLMMKCKMIQENSSIENLFLTLEGHSYEAEILKQASTINSNTVVWLRQHSPISLAQTGVFNMLRSMEEQVRILTTGLAYSEFLRNYSADVKSFLIGTSKSRSVSTSLREGNAILVAPEGTEKSTLDFLKFIYALDSRFDSYKFIFRVHPNLIANRRIYKQIRKNESKHNFRISSDTLDKDLIQTRFTIYRGSAVAIESLAFNNLPIYFNFDGNLNLNVFSILDSDYPILRNVFDQSEFLKILERGKLGEFDSRDYNRLFESLNTDLIKELFV
jgi:hypothetical protein